MNCHSARAVLDLFVEERLTTRSLARVAIHLKSCAACALEAETLRPKARLPAPTAPASLKDRLRQALSQFPDMAIPSPGYRADARAAAYILAGFSAALLALHALTPRGPSEHAVTAQDSPWRTP